MVAQESGAKRDRRLPTLEEQAAQWVGKIDGQNLGKAARGRTPLDGGARARCYHEVCEAHLSRIARLDLKSELFTCAIDARALARARLMEGKLLLDTTNITPVPDKHAPFNERRYSSFFASD